MSSPEDTSPVLEAGLAVAPETTNVLPQPTHSQKIGRGIINAAIASGLILAPVEAGAAAIALAPSAVVHNVGGLEGLDTSIQPRLDNTETIDSALLGGARRQSTISMPGLHLGFTAKPTDTKLTIFNREGSLDQNTLAVGGHLLSDTKTQKVEIDRLQSEAVRHFGGIGAGAAYMVAALEVAAYAYGKRRRMQLEQAGALDPQFEAFRRAEQHHFKVAAGIVMSGLLLPLLYVGTNQSTTHVTPTPELSGTFMSNWQITGPLTYPITQAIRSLDTYTKQERSYYKAVTTNTDKVFNDYYGTIKQEKDPDEVRIVLISGLRGTSGMAEVADHIADNYSADAIINLGDLTATGTPQESLLKYLDAYTLSVLTHNAKGIPIYTTLGPYDSPAVAASAKRLGIHVVDDQMVSIAGVPFLGFDSPTLIPFGQTATLRSPHQTPPLLTQELARRACSSKAIGIFGTDKALLQGVTAGACIPIEISQQGFTGALPQNISTPGGIVRQLTLGSTGGHAAEDGIGGLKELRNPAKVLELTINRHNGDLYATTITVQPDTSVSLRFNNSLKALNPSQLELIKAK